MASQAMTPSPSVTERAKAGQIKVRGAHEYEELELNEPEEEPEIELTLMDRLEFTGETTVLTSLQKARQLNPLDDPVEGCTGGRASNIIGGSITLGLATIILIMMMLVAGYFVAEAPTGGAYESEINTTSDVTGTAFIIFGVSLLAIPTVAVVAYFYRNGLGGFIQQGPGR